MNWYSKNTERINKVKAANIKNILFGMIFDNPMIREREKELHLYCLTHIYLIFIPVIFIYLFLFTLRLHILHTYIPDYYNRYTFYCSGTDIVIGSEEPSGFSASYRKLYTKFTNRKLRSCDGTIIFLLLMFLKFKTT
jgi:hypothetical protein